MLSNLKDLKETLFTHFAAWIELMGVQDLRLWKRGREGWYGYVLYSGMRVQTLGPHKTLVGVLEELHKKLAEKK